MKSINCIPFSYLNFELSDETRGIRLHYAKGVRMTSIIEWYVGHFVIDQRNNNMKETAILHSIYCLSLF